MKKKIIVIGRGVVGTTIAMRLSEQENCDVVVIGERATGQCASLAAQGYLAIKGALIAKEELFSLKMKLSRAFPVFIQELEEKSEKEIPYSRFAYSSKAMAGN